MTELTASEASIPHPLSEPLVDLIARRFRVLGEPTRIRLLDLLRGAKRLVELGDGGVVLAQQIEQPDAGRLSQHAKAPGDQIDERLGQRMRDRGCVRGWFGHGATLSQLLGCVVGNFSGILRCFGPPNDSNLGGQFSTF